MPNLTRSERIERLVGEAQHMTVSTVGADGRPWVSPVFYCVDEDRNLYWVSDREALHSENVRARREVAIVIHGVFDGRVDAVYLRAIAIELNDGPDVQNAIEIMATREQNEIWTIQDVSEVSGDGPWRIYQAVPYQIQLRATGTKQGKAVVGRADADT